MKKISSSKLFCFSPAVMLGTFLIEWLLAIWAIIKYQKTLLVKTIIIILILLGTFQLAEYIICTTSFSNLIWTKIGLVATNFLPPLGLYAIGLIASKKYHWIVFAPAIIFSLIYIFWINSVGQSTCDGNYVILDTNNTVARLYSLYYLGYLFWAIIMTITYWRRARDQVVQSLLAWTIIGYGSFMLPTAIVWSLSEKSREAIPSIMCGFALILALILAFKILPLATSKQFSS